MDKFPTVDELFKLAKENPELLDEIQRRESQKIIDNCKSESNKKKLEGIMFKIDMSKKKHKHRQDKVNADVANMMWESFYEMNEELQKFKKSEEDNKKPNLTLINTKK